jgi:zinc/manganese transport system substrate-binding protein
MARMISERGSPRQRVTCERAWPRATVRSWLLRLTLAAVLCLPGAARALEVFACEPEWAALVRVLVPDARIVSATHVRQDPHHIEARPALIAQLRRADLAVCTGARLEAGWLPMLQQRAGNPRVHDGAPGMFYAADRVALVDAHPDGVGPFAGDVHAEGNPHFHADPRTLLDVARGLARQIAQIAPDRAAAVAARLAAFETAWAARIEGWNAMASRLRGRTVVAQHGTFTYLWRWLGITQAVDLEPLPGMAPTPRHLQRVLGQLRAAPAPLAVVVAEHQDARPARWLVGQLPGPVALLVLPATVPDPGVPDALGVWIDGLLRALLQAAG